MSKKTMLFPCVITIAGALLMMAMLFLPFASANEEFKSYLLDYGDETYVEEIGMTNEEAVNISLFEYVKVYARMAGQGLYREAGIACIVVISAFAVFSALTLLLSILKKPVGILIFDLLALAAFWIIRFDFEYRGAVPNNSYDRGIAGWLTFVAGAAVAIGAVWMFFEKRRNKDGTYEKAVL